MQAPNLDKSKADYSENICSLKTKRVAILRADDYAENAWYGGTPEPPKHGEVFASAHWNGGYRVPVWALYDVSKTDEGYTITYYRWIREEN